MSTDEIPKTKKCKKHGELPISDFYFYKEKRGNRYCCKQCARNKTKKYATKNRNIVLQRYKNHRIKYRMMVLCHYSNSDTPFCSCCKETIYQFLVLDHIFGGGTKHRKSLGGTGSGMYGWVIKNNYPPIFRVLCQNCNAAYGAYGYCPHQVSVTQNE